MRKKLLTFIIILIISLSFTGCQNKNSKFNKNISKDASSYTYRAMVVDEDMKFGFIDEKGKELITCQYDFADSFKKNGLACVRNSQNKWGVINKNGNEIIPLKYDFCYNSGDLLGVALISGTDINGHSIKNWAFFDSTGKQLTNFKYQYCSLFPYPYPNDYHATVVSEITNKKDINGNIVYNYGIINENGKEIIPIDEQKILLEEISSNGLFAIGQLQDDGSYKWGFSNLKNELVIPYEFEDVHNFTVNGLAAVKKNGLWGYINEKGTIQIPFSYEEAESFSENGLAFVKENNGKYIDSKGNTIITGDNDWYHGSPFDQYGFADIMRRDKSGNEIGNYLINDKGDILLSSTAFLYSDCSLNISKATNAQCSCMYINKKGTLISLDKIYHNISTFGDNQWAAIMEPLNQNCDKQFQAANISYIDRNGNTTLKLKKIYYYAYPFMAIK